MTEFSSDWKLTATRQRFSLPQTLVYYIAKNPSSPELYNKIIKCCKYFWLKNPIITLNELRHYYNDIGILRSETTIGSANIINAQLENVVDKLWIHQKLIVGDEQKQLLASSLMPKIYRCDLTSLSLGFQNICFDDFKVFISSGSLEYLGLHKTIVEADDGIIAPIEELIQLLPNLQEFVFSNVTTDEGLQTITSKTAANLIAIPNFPKVQIFRLYKIPELFNFEAFFTVPKGDMNIVVSFAGPISEAYRERLEKFMDKIIAQGVTENRPPIVYFPEVNRDKFEKIRELREDYSIYY